MRFRAFIAASLMLFCAAFSLQAQNTAAQESRRARLEKEIEQLQKQIAQTNSRSSNALEELTLIRSQIAARKALVEESERQIKALDDSIAAVQANAAALQSRLDTLTIYYARLIRGAYRNRDPHMWYVHILTGRNIGQASRRYNYLRGMSAQMNAQAEKIRELQAEVASELARLASLRESAASLRDRRSRDLENLKAEEARSDKLVASLKRDRTRYQNQLATKKKQVEALNREIERIIAQYLAESKSDKKNSGNNAQVDYKLSGEFESNKGKLPWPADGPVVEKFGRHGHPVYTSLVMPFNNGIGISLLEGSEVSAVFDGEVKRVIVMPGYNKCVLIQHGGYFTFYCKLSEVSVKAGDKVKTGQVIGKVDTIDNQTRLHFQVWKEKTPQDPESWLRPR